MSNQAGTSRARDGQPPAQRRRLVQGNFGEHDVLLMSSDNVEYPSHRAQLSASCDVFSDMFEAAMAEDEGVELPKIPLMADSEAAEMILPLVYRQPVAALRSKTYKQLLKGIKLAHRLGMPMVVDILAVFLEPHVSNHALELYLLACQFDLQALEEACKPTAIRMHDIVRPNEHVDTIGLTRAADLHKVRMEQLIKDLDPPINYHNLRRKQKRCRLHGIMGEAIHWELGFMVMYMHSLQIEAEQKEAGAGVEPIEFTTARRAAIRDHFAFTKRKLEDSSGCGVKKYLRAAMTKMETRYEDMITGSTRIKREDMADEGGDSSDVEEDESSEEQWD